MDDNRDSDVEDAFIQRIVAVLQRRNELSFEESVREYRQIEAEFVARAAHNEPRALATKKIISHHLLMEAERTAQPHEICEPIWNEIVQRGFLDVNNRNTMRSFYARCCQWNGEFDAGLEVLKLVIDELEQWLQDPTLTPEARAFWEDLLAFEHKRRDEMKAGVRE